MSVEFPLNKLVSVTGVSGSGKSSLINHTLIPAIQNKLLGTKLPERVKYKKLIGEENIDKLISIDQSPIGKTPRSNPATYTGLFTYIREILQIPKNLGQGVTNQKNSHLTYRAEDVKIVEARVG